MIGIILFLVVFILFIVFAVIAYDQIVVAKVPFRTLHLETITEIIEKIDISDLDMFYDLGCGDGRVLLAVARRYKHTKCTGVEKAIWPFVLAKIKTRKYKNITVRRADISTFDFSDATIVFVYLMPSLLCKLAPRLRALPEAKIISVEYVIDNLVKLKSFRLTHRSQFAKKWHLYKS